MFHVWAIAARTPSGIKLPEIRMDWQHSLHYIPEREQSLVTYKPSDLKMTQHNKTRRLWVKAPQDGTILQNPILMAALPLAMQSPASQRAAKESYSPALKQSSNQSKHATVTLPLHLPPPHPPAQFHMAIYPSQSLNVTAWSVGWNDWLRQGHA